MKRSFLNTLTTEQQATVFREFLEQIETTNSKCDTLKIIDNLENIAIKLNYRKCPRCGK